MRVSSRGVSVPQETMKERVRRVIVRLVTPDGWRSWRAIIILGAQIWSGKRFITSPPSTGSGGHWSAGPVRCSKSKSGTRGWAGRITSGIGSYAKLSA